MSWSPGQNFQVINRFLTIDTRIQFKILCRQPSIIQELNKTKLYNLDKENPNMKIAIHGRIGRFVGCLPLQSDFDAIASQLSSTTQDDKDVKREVLIKFYKDLWKKIEHETFTLYQDSCEMNETIFIINSYSNLTGSEINTEQAAQLRKGKQQEQSKKASNKKENENKELHSHHRHTN